MARKGSNIYKRKDGRWEGRYIKERKPSGKIAYGYVYGRKYAEVKERLILLKVQYDEGRQVVKAEACGILADWLTHWLIDIIKPGIKPSTYESYQNKIQNHILPALGNRPLHKLSGEDLQQFITSLSNTGLSSNSIHAVFRILNASLQKAVDAHLLLINPCREVTLPQSVKAKIEVLQLKEQKILEKIALQDKNGIAIILALYTGMRIGEICALQWEDVDLMNGTINVRQTLQRIPSNHESSTKTEIIFGTPKTENSRRSIPVSNYLIAYLNKCKEASSSEFVVSSKGSHAEPRVVAYRFKRILQQSGLRNIHFHALRHTFATRCMELNVDVTTLSRLLGHGSTKLTLDTYTDSLMEQRRIAMSLMDQLFVKDILEPFS